MDKDDYIEWLLSQMSDDEMAEIDRFHDDELLHHENFDMVADD